MDRKERVDNILSLLRSDRIIVIDGRLKSKDEAGLIRETMMNINLDGDFRGLEIGVLHDNDVRGFMGKIRQKLGELLLGKSSGVTIIGPASIINEMRQYPESIILQFKDEYMQRHSKKRIERKVKNVS